MVRRSLPYQSIAPKKPIECDDWIVITDSGLEVQNTYSKEIDILVGKLKVGSVKL